MTPETEIALNLLAEVAQRDGTDTLQCLLEICAKAMKKQELNSSTCGEEKTSCGSKGDRP
jgi:hypothetical protein